MDDSLSGISSFQRACSSSYLADEKSVVRNVRINRHWGLPLRFWETEAFQTSNWASEALIRQQQHKRFEEGPWYLTTPGYSPQMSIIMVIFGLHTTLMSAGSTSTLMWFMWDRTKEIRWCPTFSLWQPIHPRFDWVSFFFKRSMNKWNLISILKQDGLHNVLLNPALCKTGRYNQFLDVAAER